MKIRKKQKYVSVDKNGLGSVCCCVLFLPDKRPWAGGVERCAFIQRRILWFPTIM